MNAQVRVETIQDVRRLVKAYLGGPLVWFGKRATDALGLDNISPVPVVICCDAGSDHDQWSYGAAIFALENMLGHREDWSTRMLMDYLGQSGVSTALSMLNGRTNVLPYVTTPELEKMASQYGWRILAPSMNVRRAIIDKLNFVPMLEELGLPVIPGRNLDISQVSYSDLGQEFGAKFVVQYPDSAGGKGTFLVESEATFLNAQSASASYGTKARVASFIEGSNPNVNGVVTRNGIIVTPPSYQIIGIPEGTTHFAGYCGNQWVSDSFLPAQSIYEQTKLMGLYLREKEYYGIFGLDFRHQYMLEINGRVNGGTQTMTQLCLDHQLIPPMGFHLLEMLEVPYELNVEKYNALLDQSRFEAFHLVLHNLEGKDVVVTKSVPAGVYTLVGGKLVYLREGFHMGHARNKGEFVICCGVPKQGLQMTADAPLVKVQGPGVIFEGEENVMTEWGHQVATATYKAFGLAPV